MSTYSPSLFVCQQRTVSVQILRPLVDHRLELRQRDRPVHGRIALPEHAQIDPVQDHDLHRAGRLLDLRRPEASRGSVVSARCAHAGRSRWWWSWASWPAPGGAARASSHGPKPHASTTISVWFKRSARLWHTKRTAHGGERSPCGPRCARSSPARTPPSRPPASGSAVPAGHEAPRHPLTGGVATVDVSHKFAAPAPRKQIRMRLAELTYTATQFPTVHAVRLEIAGSAVTSIGGVPGPGQMTRADFSRLLPAIVVHTPAIGAHIPSTVRVDGHVRRVRGRDGRQGPERRRPPHRPEVLHWRAAAPAAAGTTPSRSPTTSVTAQNGTIVVIDTSARGGRPPHIVRIPVRLSP